MKYIYIYIYSVTMSDNLWIFFILWVKAEKTKCQLAKEKAMTLPAIGRFMPSCKDDGSYNERQCHGSTGYCWCVDKKGREWFGTRQRGALDCTKSSNPKANTYLVHLYQKAYWFLFDCSSPLYLLCLSFFSMPRWCEDSERLRSYDLRCSNVSWVPKERSHLPN